MSRIQNILEKAERDGSVRRIRPGENVAAVATLDAPMIGAPHVIESVAPSTLTPPAPEATPARIVSGTRLDHRLVTGASSEAVAAEQYRALRTRILHTDVGAAISVVLVTSPGRSEGKTITSANLALTMAQEYQRQICLIDADLRRPQLHRMFGLPDGPGLSDVLSGRATLEEALVSVEDHQLTILPAGQSPAHPAELLGTTAMRRVIETLRSRFDRILIDAPSVAPLADVGILSPLVDSVLLVVRSGVTSKPSIHDAVAAIDGSKLLGLVLNDAA